MAFSFNPGQINQQDPQNDGSVSLQSSSSSPQDGTPSVPDSPFLFMQHRGDKMTVNAYLQIILIVASLLFVVASIILFSYSQYLSMVIESKKAQLTEIDEKFRNYPYEDMKRLSLRLSTLERMMKNYVSALSPLKFLEDVVEKQVVFNDFQLTKQSSGYSMGFSVLTTNYKALIQQLDALNLSQYSKIVPQPKVDRFSEGSSVLMVRVNTPVFVQGVLPDQVVFVQNSILDTKKEEQQQISSTTPQ